MFHCLIVSKHAFFHLTIFLCSSPGERCHVRASQLWKAKQKPFIFSLAVAW